MTNQEIKDQLKNWPSIVRKYQSPVISKSIWQICNTILPFLGIWVLMYFSLNWSYWITLPLAILNGLFLVRIFIIQHDCGHYSFFKQKRANDAMGFICSFLTSIPYRYWARSHQFHHAHNGQLEHLQIGDINTLTSEQYRSKTPFQKFRYRLFRNPIVLHIIAPIYYLLVVLRLPMELKDKKWARFKAAQIANNLLILAVYTGLALLLGWKAFLLIQGPVLAVFIIVAFWFFYVQHQHEQAYKAWQDNWDYLLSAIKGSTYYKLPKVLQWFSGNIGFHHIHHLNPRIPNYNLEKCAKENAILGKYMTTVTLLESFQLIYNKLWDEKTQRMISFPKFRQLEKLRQAAAQAIQKGKPVLNKKMHLVEDK